MKAIKIFFPGEFEDAFLYRGRLLTHGRRGVLKFVDLSKLVYRLNSSYPGVIPIYEWSFLRNDWIHNPQTKSLLRNPEFIDVFLKLVQKCSEKRVKLQLDDFVGEGEKLLVPFKFDTLLDCNIYNGRVYLATDSGFFHGDFSWDKTSVRQNGEMIKRHDGIAVNTTAKYGTVNVSGASDGLFCAVDDFGFLQESESGYRNLEPSNVGPSYRTDWCKFDLVNYGDFSKPSLLHTEHDKKRIDEDPIVLTKFTDKASGIWDLPLNPKKKSLFHVQPSQVSYSFNAGQNFYYSDSSGDLTSVRVVYKKENDEPIIDSMKKIPGAKSGEIIRTCALNKLDAVVLEFYEKICLLHNGGITTLIESPAISVRSFPQSRQYPNLITVVTEEGLWVINIVDETLLNRFAIKQPLTEALVRHNENKIS